MRVLSILPILFLLACQADSESIVDDECQGRCDQSQRSEYQYYGSLVLSGLAVGRSATVTFEQASDDRWNVVDFAVENPDRQQSWRFEFRQRSLPGGYEEPKPYGVLLRAGSTTPQDQIPEQCQMVGCLGGGDDDGECKPAACSVDDLAIATEGLNDGQAIDVAAPGFQYEIVPGSEVDDIDYMRLIFRYHNDPRLGVHSEIVVTCTDGCPLSP